MEATDADAGTATPDPGGDSHTAAKTMALFHVELDRHDILIAEDAPAEAIVTGVTAPASCPGMPAAPSERYRHARRWCRPSRSSIDARPAGERAVFAVHGDTRPSCASPRFASARALPPARDSAYIDAMQTFLLILIILAAIGALVSLVRGIIIFLKTSQADLNGAGPNISGLRQNKMMWRRVQFQALAIVLVVFFLLLSRPN